MLGAAITVQSLRGAKLRDRRRRCGSRSSRARCDRSRAPCASARSGTTSIGRPSIGISTLPGKRDDVMRAWMIRYGAHRAPISSKCLDDPVLIGIRHRRKQRQAESALVVPLGHRKLRRDGSQAPVVRLEVHRDVVHVHADAGGAQRVEHLLRDLPDASSFQPTTYRCHADRPTGRGAAASAAVREQPVVAIGKRRATRDELRRVVSSGCSPMPPADRSSGS